MTDVNLKAILRALDTEVADAMTHTRALSQTRGREKHAAVMYGNTMLLSALSRALAAGLEPTSLPVRGPVEPIPTAPSGSEPSAPPSGPTPYTPFQR